MGFQVRQMYNQTEHLPALPRSGLVEEGSEVCWGLQGGLTTCFRMQCLGLQAQMDAFRGVTCSITFLPVLFSYS